MNTYTKTKEKIKLLKPKYDATFHALFQDKNILQNFLTDILNTKVKVKGTLDRFLDLNTPDEKYGIMDLRVLLEENIECNIEIQLNEHKYEIERFLYYLCNMYARQLKKNEGYNKLHKTISIVILDHEIDKLKPFNRPDVTWALRDNITGKYLLTDQFEICIIEIPKAVRMYKKDNSNRICQWMLFLDEPNSKEVSLIMERNKEIKEATDKLWYLSKDEKLKMIEEYKETAQREEWACLETAEERGYNSGVQDGFNKGIEKTILNMLKEKIDIDTISKVTGCTKEQIEKLQNKI